MAAPTAPFSTTQQIAYMLLSMFPGQTAPDFSESTYPTLSMVTSHRDNASSILLMRFASVGYKVPFEEMDNETWPDHQTHFLVSLEILGVAGMIADAIKPAPVMQGGRVMGNLYTSMFNEWLRRIDESGCGLRAKVYAGTKAEKWITEPVAPQTDYTRDPSSPDPAKFGLILANLRYLENQYRDILRVNLQWDSVYRLR